MDVRIAAKPVNTNSTSETTASNGKASGQSFLEILMSGAGVGVQGAARLNGQAQGQADGELSGTDTTGDQKTETNPLQAQANESAKTAATTAVQNKGAQDKGSQDEGIIVDAAPSSVSQVSLPNPIVLTKLDPTLVVTVSGDGAQGTTTLAATSLETTGKAAEGKQTGATTNQRGKSSATTQATTKDQAQVQAAAILAVPVPTQQDLPALQVLASQRIAIAATKSAIGTDESNAQPSADQAGLIAKPQLDEKTQKAIEAALSSTGDMVAADAASPKTSDGNGAGGEIPSKPQSDSRVDAPQTAQKSTYLTALLAQKAEAVSSTVQAIRAARAAQADQAAQAVQAAQASPTVEAGQAVQASQASQTAQSQIANGADLAHANASHAVSAFSNTLNGNSSIHGSSASSSSSNAKVDTQNSDDSSRTGQGGSGAAQHTQGVAAQVVPVTAASTESTAGQLLTGTAAAGSAHTVLSSTTTSATSEAAPHHGADTTTAMGSDGGNAVSSGSINTARLIQNMSDTEMRVGMHSAEFGDISIRTMVSQQQVQAQISVNHSELVTALSAHIPSVQAKFGNEYGLHASIEVSQNSASFTNDSGQSSQRDQKPFAPSMAFNNLAAPVEIDRLPMRAIAPAMLDATRLDIRA